MRRVLFAVLLTNLLLIATLSSSGSQTKTSATKKDSLKVQAGQAVFTQKCLACHSTNQGQSGFGPSLYGEMKKGHPKKSAAEIRSILKNGKGKMPAFGSKLAPEDTDHLLAYLQTL